MGALAGQSKGDALFGTDGVGWPISGYCLRGRGGGYMKEFEHPPKVGERSVRDG